MSSQNSPLELRTVAVGPPAVVAASGSLDIATVVQLESVLDDCMTTHGSVVLDMSGLTMCDSAGLGALVRIQRRAQSLNVDFAVSRPRPHIVDVLAMTGIDKVIPVLHT
jgi:anti-sigma B factor antagonist